MSRCKQCGEPEVSPDKFGCGSTPGRQSARCMRLVDPSYRQKKQSSEINFGGCPKSQLRLQMEAMPIGTTRIIIDEDQGAIQHVQNMLARSNCGKLMMVRRLPEGCLVHMVPDIESMQVGDSVRYTADLWMITRFCYCRNREHAHGREDRAYCFDLVDGFYNLRRVR